MILLLSISGTNMSDRIKNKTEAIANLILKGVNNKPIDNLKKEEFKTNHKELIEKTINFKLRTNPLEAALISCSLVYGTEKTELFASNYKQSIFQGLEDPVCLLWSYYSRNLKYKTSQHLYAVSLTAIRAYCEGRTMKRLEPSKTDVYK